MKSLCPGTTPAQQAHSHDTAAQPQLTPSQGALVKIYTLHVWAWKDNPNGAFELASERFLPVLRRPTVEADQEISLRIRFTNFALKSEKEKT